MDDNPINPYGQSQDSLSIADDEVQANPAPVQGEDECGNSDNEIERNRCNSKWLKFPSDVNGYRQNDTGALFVRWFHNSKVACLSDAPGYQSPREIYLSQQSHHSVGHIWGRNSETTRDRALLLHLNRCLRTVSESAQ